MRPLVLVSCLCVALFAADRIGPPEAYPPVGVTGDRDKAVTQATINSTICVVGYTATVRSVTEATKKQILARDKQMKSGCCEVDHYLSLENGGSNDPDKNLWAEPYSGKYNARVKDVVEKAVNRAICSGKMTLYDGQACLTTDWIACGLKLKAIK
jgi:hypothetical protein